MDIPRPRYCACAVHSRGTLLVPVANTLLRSESQSRLCGPDRRCGYPWPFVMGTQTRAVSQA